jgi:twitching motility protein PilI
MPAPDNGSLRSLRDHPFELLRELDRRSKAAAGGHGDDMAAEEWVGIAFRLGDEQFLVSRAEVREILMVPPAVTRVPGAKSWVRGLANVRGQLLPIFDLREFLGYGTGGGDRTARVLVLNNSECLGGLLVDEVQGFRRFYEREYSSSTPGTRVRCERFLSGSFRRGGEAWPVFGLGRLLAARDFQRAAAD